MTDNLTDEQILADLDVEIGAKPARTYSPLEARLIAGFEDIQRFYEEHARAPTRGEQNDIFERLYAVRLDRLRANAQARELLVDMDTEGLLDLPNTPVDVGDSIDDEALLAELGNAVATDGDDITQLRNVSPTAHRRAAEEIAGREICRDFANFEPIFRNAGRL
jgi:hypothetical protein